MNFVMSRFLDQLGMSATFDTKVYCRQSLIGGNYALLNATTFEPNPDYYRLVVQIIICYYIFYIATSI